MWRFGTLFLLVFASLSSSTFAQNVLDAAYTLQYTTENEDGSLTTYIFSGTSEAVLQIPVDHCSGIYVEHDLALIWKRGEAITIRRISDTEIFSVVDWNSDWELTCQIYLQYRQEQLMLRVHYPLGNRVEYVDPYTGEIAAAYNLNDAADEERYRAQLPRRAASDPLPRDFLPDHTNTSPANYDLTIGVRCTGIDDTWEATPRGNRCHYDYEVVLFNRELQSVITELQNGAYWKIGQSWPLTFHVTYQWSPYGKYIAYATIGDETYAGSPIAILNVSTLQEIDTTSILLDKPNINPAMRWSPRSESEFAFITSDGSDSYDLVIFDFETAATQEITIPYDYRQFEWLPDGNSILLLNSDQSLVRVYKNGEQELIAENVIALRSLYDGEMIYIP